MPFPRVAHVVPTDRIAYYMQRARLQRLLRAGFQISIICGRSRSGLPDHGRASANGSSAGSQPAVKAADSSYGEELEKCGLEIIYIPFAREISPFTDIRCAAALLDQIRQRRFDIIHSHNPKGGLLSPPMGQLAGTPTVVHTVHGFLFNESTTGLRRGLAIGAERWTASWCDHLLFQSEEDFDYACRHRFKDSGRLHLIGNGIDEDRFDPGKYPGARERTRRELGWDSSHLVVGMVGRLVAEKGLPEFFEMAGRLSAELPEARFLVVGISEEDQSDALDPLHLIAQNGLIDRCAILERRSDMAELYMAMDVLALPSHREGISRALLEASGMGVACVASDIRGCREVVRHGETGMLAPLRDVGAFAKAVATLLRDEQLRSALGRRARQRVLDNYTEELTAKKIAACYEQILAYRAA